MPSKDKDNYKRDVELKDLTSLVDGHEQLYQGKQAHHQANCCSKMMFWWMSPVIKLVNKNDKIVIEQLGELHHSEKLESALPVLEKKWQQALKSNAKGNILFRTVFTAYKWEYINVLFWNIFRQCLNLTAPFIIKYFTIFLQTGDNYMEGTIDFWDFSTTPHLEWLTTGRQWAITLSLILVVFQVINFLIEKQLDFIQNMIGARSTGALITMIYQKQLRLSHASNKKFDQGQIINFIQSDANKLQWLSTALPQVTTLPGIFLFCIVYLFYALGWSFIFGFFVIFFGMYTNLQIAKAQGAMRKTYMKTQDRRMNLTTEFLQNIKIIKMYAWEKIFLKLIGERRNDELKVLNKLQRLSSISTTFIYFFPSLLQTATFTGAIYYRGSISLGEAFLIMNIFRILQGPITQLPNFVGAALNFLVSMKRIQDFLLCDEVDHNLIENGDGSSAIEIKEGSNFHWGFEKKEEEIADKKKKAKKSKKGKKDDDFKKLEEPLVQAGAATDVEVPKEDFILKSLNLTVKKGEFVCVIGSVGSGKSSLLSTVIGDMIYSKQPFVNKEDPTASEHSDPRVLVNQSISYSQQIPWIQNMTIRDNILFGLDYDEEKYNETIKICELTRDLEILPDKDQTEIGEKGINLSGGQKARISLARAIYADREMVLLDDPISALDANVKKKIFENVLLEHLKEKTIILVTHAIDFLHLVDRIVVFNEGEIVLQGSYDEIKNDPYLVQLKGIHDGHKEMMTASQEITASEVAINAEDVEEPELMKALSIVKDKNASPEEEAKTLEELAQELKEKKEKGKMIKDESEEKINVTWQTYKDYFGGYFGGCTMIVVSNIAMILYTSFALSADYIIGDWTSQKDQLQKVWLFSSLSLTFACCSALSVYIRMVSIYYFSLKMDKKLHEKMIEAVGNAPINKFFDITPIGRLLNKFSSDLNELSAWMAMLYGSELNFFYALLQVVIIAAVAVYWFIVIFPLLIAVAFYVYNDVRQTIQETQRIEKMAKSPIVSFLQESISGTSTIRAFGYSEQFMEKQKKLVNDTILASQMSKATSQYFKLRLNVAAVNFVACICFICIYSQGQVSPILLGLLLTYSMNVQYNITVLINIHSFIEKLMVNAQRCMLLTKVVQEKQSDYVVDEIPDWPQQGKIEFKEVDLKYRDETEIVLNKLSFNVQPREKIGIVGRTGSGKSTICISISRIVELFKGQILIDGVDISKINLNHLRSRITVIPQDPILFKGTLRYNLDPGSVIDPAYLEKVYKQTEMTIGLDKEIDEGGSNLSNGEKQLVCICRAIMRKCQVVILDEATSNIDIVTEERIQALLDTFLQDSTVLTVAHRLNTIIKSDKVLVLSYGQVKEFDSPANLMQDPESEFTKLLQELKKKEE